MNLHDPHAPAPDLIHPRFISPEALASKPTLHLGVARYFSHPPFVQGLPLILRRRRPSTSS